MLIFIFPCLEDNSSKAVHEFVSDMLQASSEDIVEVREGMKKLALRSKVNGKISLKALGMNVI